MEPAERKLLEFIDGALDGSGASGPRQQLFELIEQNHGLVDDLIVQMRVHSLLQWHCDEHKVGVTTAAQIARSSRPATPLPGIVRFLARRWLWAAGIVLVLGGAIFARHLWLGSQSLPSVAEIVDQQLVVWSDETNALLDGKRIVPGRLSMKSGSVTMRFRSGATVSATGDVSMRVNSDMLLQLDRGQATAHVPEWAKGFTILTPTAKVVDLGTKFGVVARNGGFTDVLVFEGEVDLKPTSIGGDAQRRLTQGEGARINNAGSIDRIVEIRRNSGGESWTTDLRLAEESVFKSIRDNLHSYDSANYYQITPLGLMDDALAYVDRPHEWNGLTTDGLPDFLRHADYIRTFNATRYFSKLEIVVELARPAMVYIFFDRRVPAPEWLKEQFEETDVEIGLDEGPLPSGDVKHATVAVGGGQSVDTVFRVWRRRCASGDVLTFGPLGQRLKDCAMYGIAAAPLQ